MSGYTLLEMLIVLMIMGFVAGVAAPQLANMYESVTISQQRKDILKQVSTLSYKAFRQAKKITITNYPQPSSSKEMNNFPLLLPEKWSVQVDKPILYYENGVCAGGNLTLKYVKVEYLISLSPPLCQVSLQINS